MLNMNEAVLSTNTGGVVQKAALVGSDNPEIYMRRWQRDLRKPGGYRLQMSPHDIAALISYARPYMKNKRMLCIGAETCGAEKFIAEELGMVEVNLKGEKPHGTYDLVTIFGEGEYNLGSILEFTHVNSLVAVLNTNKDAQRPGLRQVWMDLRRMHFPLLQTVDRYDMGVGMVKITYEEKKHANAGPLYTKRLDGAIRESGGQSQAEQPAQAIHSEAGQRESREESGEEGQGEGRKDHPQRAEEEAGRGTPHSASVQEGRPEDLQEGEVGDTITLAHLDSVMEFAKSRTVGFGGAEIPKALKDSWEMKAEKVLDDDAPYGRKKNGEPKKRPGAKVHA